MTVAAPPKPWDVPPLIALGALALAAAIIFPLVRPTALYPTVLPPLAIDGAALMAEHRRDLARTRPVATTEALAAWNALTLAQSRSVRERAGWQAQATFASQLFEATEGAPEARLAVRAVAAQQFLANLANPVSPGTIVARRHGLTGPEADPTITDAHRLGWFFLRWERLALPTPEHGHVEPLTDTLLRITPATQRAFASWLLSASCNDITGSANPDPRACAEVRRPMIAFATRVDPRYPRDEALAATDVMLAVGLRHPRVVPGDERRGTDLEEAQAALHQAQDRYQALSRAQPDRRWTRYSLAVLRELSE